MRQCNEHEKVSEYHRSCKELKIFLRDKRTIDDLGISCVSAITMFAESLIDKETYLGNHMRLYTTNCMDSETTSPVESQNSIVKEKLGVTGKMDIHKGIEKIADNTNRSIQKQKEHALRSLNQANMASRSPTKDYIIVKSQALADTNYDRRKAYQLCRIDKNTWWCWLFRSDNNDETRSSLYKKWPWCSLPRFLRVRQITRKTSNAIDFLWCDCGYYDRIGLPCSHIFRLVDDMSLNMFHIRHWKMYDGHYGDNSALGRLMMHAQVILLNALDSQLCFLTDFDYRHL